MTFLFEGFCLGLLLLALRIFEIVHFRFNGNYGDSLEIKVTLCVVTGVNEMIIVDVLVNV